MNSDDRLVTCADAYWSHTATGLYLLTPQGETTIDGAVAEMWLNRLLPYLHGAHTVGELLGALTSQRRDFVFTLLENLVDAGFLLRAHPEPRTVQVHHDGGRLAASVLRAIELRGLTMTTATPDLMIAVADDPDRCPDTRRAGTPLAQAVLAGATAWCIPPTHGPGWAHAWRRMTDLNGRPDEGSVDEATMRIAANQFAAALNNPCEQTPVVLRLGMDSARHRFLAHPRCEPLPPDAAQSMDALTDQYFGVLGPASDGGFTQLPLRVAEVAVAGCGPVTGVGIDIVAAREAARERGLAEYARRFTLARSGVRLSDQRRASLSAQRLAKAALGIASDRESATHAALLTLLTPLLAARAVLTPAITAEGDAALDYCAAMLNATRLDWSLHPVRSGTGIPGFAGVLDGTVRAFTLGATALVAARECALRLVADYQVRTTAEQMYAPQIPAELPDALIHQVSPDHGEPDIAALVTACENRVPIAVTLDADPALPTVIGVLFEEGE